MNEIVQQLHRAGASPARAPAAATEPLCFVVDPKPGIRELVTNVCRDLGLRVEAFERFADMIESGRRAKPDVVFMEPAVDGREGDDAIPALASAGFRCPIQLMSGLNPVLTEEIRRLGERQGLTMLPVLHKPFRHPTVREIVDRLGLRRDSLAGVKVSLTEALAQNWVELWYQPKIDLGGRIFAGAEGYMRVRHPQHGVLPPDSILNGAGSIDLLSLTQYVLVRALQDWPVFASVGVPIRFSINIPAFALSKLPLCMLISEHRPKAANWPGLILEISEDEIIHDLALAQKVARELRPLNVSLAIDDFGRAYSALAPLKDTPFVEIKIDRSFVANCDTDRTNAGLCETIIGLAHRLRSKAVAEGIETPGELKALHRMGCDLGQGFLFARPMPREHFLKLLRERGKGKPGP